MRVPVVLPSTTTSGGHSPQCQSFTDGLSRSVSGFSSSQPLGSFPRTAAEILHSSRPPLPTTTAPTPSPTPHSSLIPVMQGLSHIRRRWQSCVYPLPRPCPHRRFTSAPPPSLFPPLSPTTLTHLSSLASLLVTGHRSSLSRAITLLESSHPIHQQEATHLLSLLSSHPPSPPPHPRSLRIAVSGPPGVGKSTFIEQLGQWIVDGKVQSHRHSSVGFSSGVAEGDQGPAGSGEGKEGRGGGRDRLAILTVDPSSHLTGGSILGDRTRMPLLSSHPSVYIRPSPSKLSLGGVHPSTYSSLNLCGLAGYNIQLIETVGIGQSEIAVRPMVDCMILLVPPGGGDELQGMKRGVVEVVDFVVVNKADGGMEGLARHTVSDYRHAIQLRGVGRGGNKGAEWPAEVLMCSSVEEGGGGVGRVWERIQAFDEWLGEDRKRQRRGEEGVRVMMQEVPQVMWGLVRGSERGRRVVRRVEGEVLRGEVDVRRGAHIIVEELMRGFIDEYEEQHKGPP